ncbi:2OG-Fe(II) oxygenase [Cupriavidus necator]|uniref:2OG-Fe(II) oxygenase n=1 Tax=Cupriavidus necator TaxID=106590 RepID=UPI0038B3CC96
MSIKQAQRPEASAAVAGPRRPVPVARGAATRAAQGTDMATRVDHADWDTVAGELDSYGCAAIRGVLAPAECEALAAGYAQDVLYRSRIVMARHGFGQGEYKYFAYPLPEIVAALRSALYPRLVPVANRWNAAMGIDVRYPAAHEDYLARCHRAGQLRPTPLLLRYGPGDYNCLHQDLYGEQVFPLQVAILLSEPGRDFTGGEFVMTEQRPRMQSRAEVVTLHQGDAVVFAVSQRPVQGSRGAYRVNLRHGVSRLHAGQRYTLGIIFHDAT